MENSDTEHWSQEKERVSGYGPLKLLIIMFRFLPVWFIRAVAFPVGFFYFLFSKKAVEESRRFFGKVAPFVEDPALAKKCRSFFAPLRHIISYSLTMLEKIQAWTGTFRFEYIHHQNDDVKDLIDKLENGQGVFIIASHYGNTELLRGLANLGTTGVSKTVPVTTIMNMEVADHYNRMLKELNPLSHFDIISTRNLGPQVGAILEEKLSSGTIVTITGDRTPEPGKTFVKNSTNIQMIPFLGDEAGFPSGVFYLAVLMNAPTYFIFAKRRGDLSIKIDYDMHVHRFPLPAELGRKERLRMSSEMAISFASYLEKYAKEKPFQWYNFYNFWVKGV